MVKQAIKAGHLKYTHYLELNCPLIYIIVYNQRFSSRNQPRKCLFSAWFISDFKVRFCKVIDKKTSLIQKIGLCVHYIEGMNVVSGLNNCSCARGYKANNVHALNNTNELLNN